MASRTPRGKSHKASWLPLDFSEHWHWDPCTSKEEDRLPEPTTLGKPPMHSAAPAGPSLPDLATSSRMGMGIMLDTPDQLIWDGNTTE